ncbi:uncharacterized protein LOC144100095 [Amblyomma americanum]
MGVSPSNVWDPHRPLPLPLLKLFIDVKGNRGLHIFYPFGWMKNFETTLPTPYFYGMTARMFCFAPNVLKQIQILVYEEGNEQEWNVGLDVTSAYVYYSSSEGPRGKKRVYAAAIAPIGSYYSIAVQMVEDRMFKLLFNDQEKYNADMDTISGKTWKVRFSVGDHVVCSLHYTDEKKKFFPANGLGPSFWFPGLKLKVGTSVKFQGEAVRFNEADIIEAKFGHPDMSIAFNSGNWYVGRTIAFLVKRTEESFLILADFANEGARRISPGDEPYKSGEIKPEFSDSFRLLNVYVEWSTFTS